MTRNLGLLLSVLLVVACSSSSTTRSENKPAGTADNADTVDSALAGLVGTWRSGGPARLGFSGATWHSYHPDGTLTSNVNVVDKEGCRHITRYVGEYGGTAGTLSVTMRAGTLEVAHCPDPTKNVAERALTAEELARDSADANAFSLDGDVLTFERDNGVSVTHQRVRAL